MSNKDSHSAVVNKEIEAYLKIRNSIDMKKVCDLLGFVPHKGQQEILDITQKREFNALCLVTSRRFGKSTVISKIAMTDLLCPFAKVLVVAPTFTNAKIIFDNVYKDLMKTPLKIKTKDMKGLKISLENYSSIVVVSEKNYENALGSMFTTIIFEESQSINGLIDIYENYLLPAQSDVGVSEKGYAESKVYFIGTARSKDNDFYKLYRRADNPKYKGWISKTYPIYSNPLIPLSFIEMQKESLPEETFNREYLGIWSDHADELVYFGFNSENNIVKLEDIKAKINEHSKFLVGIDPGYTDGTGYLLAYVEPLTGAIYIVEEYKKSKISLGEHYKNWSEIESKYVHSEYNILRYIDPSASQVSTDLASEYNYTVLPAYNKIEHGIRLVNEAFIGNQLFIADTCTQLIDEIENMSWKANTTTYQVNRSSVYGHFDLALSSLRYLVASHLVLGDMTITRI